MVKRIGDEFEIRVDIRGAISVSGVGANITYDPSIIDAVDDNEAVEGTQIKSILGDFYTSPMLLANIISDIDGNQVPGTVVCSYSALPAYPSPEEPTDGYCFSLFFKALAAGTTTVEFVLSDTLLTDGDGEFILVDVENDFVDVLANAVLTITIV